MSSQSAPLSSAIPVGQFMQVGAYRVHYHEAGQPSADKPSLVFLHGSGPGASGYSNFHLNAPFFAAAGFHVLMPDYLGYGLSDKPREIAYTSTLHVSVLHQFLGLKGLDKVVLVGNSLGGAIAFQYALSHPQQVAKVVVMGPGGVEDPAQWAAQMSGLRCMGAFIQGRKHDRESFRELLQQIVADPQMISDAIIDSRLPIWLEQPPEVYSTMHVDVFAERLAELQMPVLCLWGREDNFLPVHHAWRVAEWVRDVRVVVSSRSGHWFMLEEPDYFNQEVLSFLK